MVIVDPRMEKDEDRRDRKTYRELLKNKLRAMGIKNPMVLGDTDEKVMKIMTRSDGHVGPDGEDKKIKIKSLYNVST